MPLPYTYPYRYLNRFVELYSYLYPFSNPYNYPYLYYNCITAIMLTSIDNLPFIAISYSTAAILNPPLLV